VEQHEVERIVAARGRAADEARPQALAAVRDAGALSARERLAALFDDGVEALEYGILAAAAVDGVADAPADGLIGALGRVHGAPVVAAAYDRTVLDGTQSDRNQRKLARLVTLATMRRLPFVCFVEGDGARPGDPLPPPPVVIGPRARWDVYDGLAEMNGLVPTVAVVTGRVLDGNAGIAFLADCVIAVRGAEFGSRDRATGAVVTRGVEVDAADGHVDLLAEDEDEAIAAVRRYLAQVLLRSAPWEQDPGYEAIGEVIPDNRRRAYDMRRIVRAFADRDSIFELGAGWATSMITAFARIEGRPIGIFANQPLSPLAGAIDAAAADKAARFIELCDAYELPLVSFIDNPGYMVGPQAERDGIARHHARPLAALQHRTVPLCSVQLRKAYGLGPYAMSGYGTSRIQPELRLAWPSVESGGGSLEGAAFLVKRKEIQAASTPEEARAIRDHYAETMRDATTGLRAGQSYSFDDVVLPAETRRRIADVLAAVPTPIPTVKKHTVDLR